MDLMFEFWADDNDEAGQQEDEHGASAVVVAADDGEAAASADEGLSDHEAGEMPHREAPVDDAAEDAEANANEAWASLDALQAEDEADMANLMAACEASDVARHLEPQFEAVADDAAASEDGYGMDKPLCVDLVTDLPTGEELVLDGVKTLLESVLPPLEKPQPEPVQNHQQEPVQNHHEPVQNHQEPVQNPQEPVQNPQELEQNPQEPVQNPQQKPTNSSSSSHPSSSPERRGRERLLARLREVQQLSFTNWIMYYIYIYVLFYKGIIHIWSLT